MYSYDYITCTRTYHLHVHVRYKIHHKPGSLQYLYTDSLGFVTTKIESEQYQTYQKSFEVMNDKFHSNAVSKGLNVLSASAASAGERCCISFCVK